MTRPSDESIDRFFALTNAYVSSDVLAAACGVGLFDALADHPGADFAHLADRLGLASQPLRTLLLGCCSLGLVQKTDGGYRNSELSTTLLASDAPYSMADYVRMNCEIQQPGCGRFQDVVRASGRQGSDEASGGRDLYARMTRTPEVERTFHHGMSAFTRLMGGGSTFAELDRVEHLLDVGGGDGSSACSFCRHHPQLRVTILEHPSVCEIGARHVREQGLDDRIEFVATDIFDEDWPRDCDAVMFSHLVEIFRPERALDLYRRAFRALPGGGQVLVWTVTANDDETGPFQAVKTSVYFLTVASGEGMAYPAWEHERWLQAAGFVAIRRRDVPARAHAALVGTKP